MLASNCRKSSGVKEIDNDSYQRGNCKCGGSPAWRISPLFPIWGKSVCQTIFLMYLLTVVNQRTRLIHQIPRRNNISPRWRICATFYLLFISCCYYFPLIPFHLELRPSGKNIDLEHFEHWNFRSERSRAQFLSARCSIAAQCFKKRLLMPIIMPIIVIILNDLLMSLHESP